MTVLILAKHDNAQLNDATAKAYMRRAALVDSLATAAAVT